ncbi:hypothetical protein ETAA8_15310 [Anatilimnocola aggregata]|uniref:DUF3299 domain-containing protein n=1 Tax=Anatilimnocola aggregata TaxID=2528021 RepID=A0A517Y8A1_9BACT|nr:hypothetical protein [Anatilimnocola aggregata]QDU26453.1 hypothetical protein ETAA8_15310 [Anatilimnocola aggregata]
MTLRLLPVLSGLFLLLTLVGCSYSPLPTQVAQATRTAPGEGNATVNETTSPAESQPPTTEAITWERLDIGMEPDSVYQPWMLKEQVKVLEGMPVRIKGYMHGALFQKNNIRTFHLLREVDCPFGPGGQAHHAIEVELQGSLRTSFTKDERTIEGIFSVVPVKGENGNTWSLYRIAGTSIQ